MQPKQLQTTKTIQKHWKIWKKINEKNVDNLRDLQDPKSSAMATDLIKDLDKLKEAVAKGDTNTVDQLSKTIPEKAAKLQEQGRKDQHSNPDAKSKIQANKALENLGGLIRDELEKAKISAKNPSNTKQQDEFKEADKKTREALSKLGGPQADLTKQIEEHQKNRENLTNAANNGDKKGVEDAIKNLEKSKDKIEKKTKTLADSTDDPVKKKDLLDALNNFKEDQKEEFEMAKKVSANPNVNRNKLQNASRDVEHALDNLQNPEDTLDNVANHQIELLDRLRENAEEKPDPEETKKVGDKLDKNNKKLVEKAKQKSSKEDDPLKKDHTMSAIDTLEKIVPEEIKTANNEVVKNPNDEKAKEKFHDQDSKVREAVNSIVGLDDPYITTAKEEKAKINELKEAAKKGDKKNKRSLI